MYKELVETVVRRLVEKPDAVNVSIAQESGKDVVQILVDPQDRGRVIGREGQTIRAIRMMVSAVIAQGIEVQVVIVE